jgi:predicted O-methyltransferase YrrM
VAVNFALNLAPLRAVLELGTGYSTLLWGTFAPQDVRVFSVDGKPIEHYDIHEPLAAMRGRVDFVNRPTITREQYQAFYDGAAKTAFLGADAAVLREHARAFAQPTALGYARTLNLDPDQDPKAFRDQALDAVFRNGAVQCLSTLLPAHCAKDLEYCQDPATDTAPTALDQVLDQAPALDAVFFDCGEFSTMVEWELLQPRIRPGGLAMFHDVHFPKSVKSFLICAALSADPQWEILYTDRTTPQGLLVARRTG